MAEQREHGIAWTEQTWNPLRGCSRVSPGCMNCYAEDLARRFAGPGLPYEGLVTLDANGKPQAQWNSNVKFVEKRLLAPIRWKRSRKIFVNSMSDLFHPNVPDEWIDKIFAVMALAQHQEFQVLTKRPERMLAWVQRIAKSVEPLERAAREIGYTFQWENIPLLRWPLQHVFLGFSAEDQKWFDERWQHAQHVADMGWKVWVSYEPALGSLSLRKATSKLAWVVVGGESGNDARPFDVNWARTVVKECQAADVPVFVKQLGANPIRIEYGDCSGCTYDQDEGTHQESTNQHPARFTLRDKKGSDMTEFPEDLRVRQWPK